MQKRRYDLLEGVRVLRQLVARYQPDVVCATGYKADVLAAWLADTPSVATLRGWTAQDAKVRLFEWLDRRTLRRHDSVIVVSNTLREAAIRAGAAPERVFWVPNAIDPDQLPPPRLREDLCREIGADPGQPLVGAVGRLSPEKGHRVLIDAFARLRNRLPGARLAIAGDGPEEASLRRQVEALGLSGHVTFMGLRADGQQIIAALDVMVLPSFSEGMPNVLLEAFAYGTPVVATEWAAFPTWCRMGARAGSCRPATPRRSLLRFRRRSKTGPRRNDGSLGLAAFWRRASPSRSRPPRGSKP